jgi:hypothetical protein
MGACGIIQSKRAREGILMRSKSQASVKGSGKPEVHNGSKFNGHGTGSKPSVLTALESNIQQSFDEIDTLRGTLQYWESRRPATDPRERDMLTEAFRIMHGELLGLTARMKELLERAELAPKA